MRCEYCIYEARERVLDREMLGPGHSRLERFFAMFYKGILMFVGSINC
jgi:hypothetical protein